MKRKIGGLSICMLMIVAVLPIVGAVNSHNALPAASTLIGIKIVAEVTYVSDPHNLLGGSIHANDTITGKYVYDTTASDTNPDPNTGSYRFSSPPCGFEVNAGGFVFKPDPNAIDFNILIGNDIAIGGYPPFDIYGIASENYLPLSNGLLVTHIEWALQDSTAAALSSTDLPTTAPILTDWNDENRVLIDGESPSNPDHVYRISAHVTEATKPIAINVSRIGNDLSMPSIALLHSDTHPFTQFWIKIFERFPHAFPILRQLIGY